MSILPSVRVRLTLWYVLLLAVILAAFIAGVYLVLRQALYSNLDQSIENQASILLDAIQVRGDGPSLDNVVATRVPDEAEHYARVFDASANLTFDGSVALGEVPEDLRAVARALGGSSETRRFKAEGDPIRARTFPISRDGQIVGVLEVGQSEDDVADTLGKLLLIMGIAYPVTLVVAVLGGVFLAGRALAPVDKMTGLARRISAERLGQRLNLRLPDDELGRLARTFDEMIGRLDDAFRRQRRFTADASHELRTPLTIMKGEVDVALQRSRDPEDYRKVLQAVNDEVDRLIHLSGSLLTLTLTRADAGEIPLTLEGVSAADVVSGAVEHMRSTALRKGVDLRLAPGDGVTLWADEDLLLQVLINLLDNAIKYTPAGGQVTAGWSVNGDRIEMWVRDTGAGIPEEHTPFIFDRFYRVDKARSRSDGGVGLGLAISRWIVEAHGGSIRVESVSGEGSTFTVRLPMVR